jgi:HKD family nuclease
MNLLTSNIPPVRLSGKTFADTFSAFLDEATRIDIAVGYITADSLAWLHEALKSMTNIETMNLIIGMHYWDKFTEREYKTAEAFDKFLHSENRGTIRLVRTFKYHGKLYSWADENGVCAGVIGSDNLSSIITSRRLYEVSALLSERDEAQKIRAFIDELNAAATVGIEKYMSDGRGFRVSTDLLEGHEGVGKVDRIRLSEIIKAKTEMFFDLPLKGVDLGKPPSNRDGSKSNLNCFFGKGRVTQNGRILPRPWYEVEFIPGEAITSLSGYPKTNTPFSVVTAEGWTFDCQVQGGKDGLKNFRSSGDLQTLGMWVKGRMEDAGVLDIGHIVTTDTIKKFGKSAVRLTKTAIENIWYIEFVG